MERIIRYKVRKVDGYWQVDMNRQGIDPENEWVKLSQASSWEVAMFVATYDVRYRFRIPDPVV